MEILMIDHINYFDKDVTAAAKKQLHQHASWFLALGISLVALGGLAIYFSAVATLISIFYLGLLLIVLGIFETIQATNLSRWSSFFLHLFLGVIYIVGGGLIIAHPLISEINITLLLAFFFIVGGILKTIFALTHHMVNQGWRIVDGLVTLLLGILILQQWPESGLWVLGTFMGINMLLTGWTWIMLSFAAKQIK